MRFADTQGCPSVGLPANGERQNNVLYKTKPMFVLDTRSVKEGYLPGKSYSCKLKQMECPTLITYNVKIAWFKRLKKNQGELQKDIKEFLA